MISVCMATYNGAEYLSEQLKSILGQLPNDGEIIIVDDCSVDNTIEIIDSLCDPRINIIKNSSNVGPTKSFERAILASRGDLIFLSDQDDVWVDNKVETIVDYFDRNKDVQLIVSDAYVCDGDRNVLYDSFLSKRALKLFPVDGFISNIIKNGYLGCAMSFRSELKETILPFPLYVPMHDMWIGGIANMYSKVLFLEESLIYYRRHGANETSLKSGSIFTILRYRVLLIRALLSRFF